MAAHEDPRQRHYLELYKLGTGPLYSFYTPYHLCHFEVPNSIARAVLFNDATVSPLGGPRVEAITTAKRPLRQARAGRAGGYDTYTQAGRPT
jgi:predicted homoserine dehydrogenase-like protein